MNVDTIDISTKDSSGFRDLLGGQKSFSLSADGLMDFDATAGDTDVQVNYFTQMLWQEQKLHFVLCGTLDDWSLYYTGSGFITSLK